MVLFVAPNLHRYQQAWLRVVLQQLEMEQIRSMIMSDPRKAVDKALTDWGIDAVLFFRHYDAENAAELARELSQKQQDRQCSVILLTNDPDRVADLRDVAGLTILEKRQVLQPIFDAVGDVDG